MCAAIHGTSIERSSVPGLTMSGDCRSQTHVEGLRAYRGTFGLPRAVEILSMGRRVAAPRGSGCRPLRPSPLRRASFFRSSSLARTCWSIMRFEPQRRTACCCARCSIAWVASHRVGRAAIDRSCTSSASSTRKFGRYLPLCICDA